jgi:hypothetical protein
MSDNKGSGKCITIFCFLLHEEKEKTRTNPKLGNPLSSVTDTVGKAGKGVTNTVGNTVSSAGKGVSDTVGSATKGVGDTTKGNFSLLSLFFVSRERRKGIEKKKLLMTEIGLGDQASGATAGKEGGSGGSGGGANHLGL